MEEADESEANWLESWREELMIRELPQVDRNPLFINKLSSTTVYSGPTICDIESALVSALRSVKSHGLCTSQPKVSRQNQQELITKENKYKLRIKSNGNGLHDDGYRWRKYGQKSIKNSLNPRSYYRCTNPRCNAKKQVERSMEDPDVLIVSYEGLHLHYTYSYFLLSRPQDYSADDLQYVEKKPRHHSIIQQAKAPNGAVQGLTTHSPSMEIEKLQHEVHERSPHRGLMNEASLSEVTGEDILQQHGPFDDIVHSSQGLLEDIVPLMVRKPCNPTTSFDDPCPLSKAASPSFSWTPNSPDLDLV